MPKVNDIKAYWQELAKKNGLDEETTKVFTEALDKDAVKKAFSEGFKPLPDYSHDLDTVRERTRQEKDAEYQKWYEGEQAKYQEYLKAEERLKQYEAKFGTIDAGNPPSAGKVGLTREELDQILEQRMAQRDSAYMDLLEIRESHLGTFKKPLDVQAFEKAWKDNPNWGSSMKAAYKFFTEPDMEKIREAEFESKLKQRYDEGVRDGWSRKSLPVDSASKEFSPMFDRKEDVLKMTERDQERHSREAFFEELRGGPKSA